MKSRAQRLSQRAAEASAAGRHAYYDGLPLSANPCKLGDRLRWAAAWRAARDEVDAIVEREVERAKRSVSRGVNAPKGV
jgi:hypothetical protein